ncbi:MAG: CoA transferase [Chloroflexi bacterium]|nr:CoA transferase [Chloroflexota bacterium]
MTSNDVPGAHVFDGVRIADFAWVGVGPNATMQMAFHGAEVIRVESSHRPDTFRNGGPRPPGVNDLDASAYFAKFNRGKRSVAINLAHPRGAEVAKRLVASADVVTESFAPGFMHRIGLSYEEVRKIKPDVIMCSMSMEGQTGPHAKFRGFGLTLQATAGITGVTGWPDRSPVGTGVAYTDWVATHLGIIGILSALDHRRRTGEGQYIDLSQFEASTLVLDAGVIDAANTGRVARPLGNRDLRHAPHGVYPCADDHTGGDRWVAIAVTNDDQWRRLALLLDRQDWLESDELCDAAGRLAAQDALDAGISRWTRTQTVGEVEQILQAVGIPAHRASNVRDAHEDPQLAHRNHWWTSDHPVIGEMSYESPAWRLSDTPPPMPRRSPLLGEDSEYVYRKLCGYSEEEFQQLIVEGVVE